MTAARFGPLFAGLALALCGVVTGQQPARVLDFNRDVRPILSDRCFHCHGFDAQSRKAGLRLDTWEGMNAERKDGVRAVVPGDPANSALVARVTHEDPRRRMPPAKSGLQLTDAEIETLTLWVEQGAPFADHWAFLPPARVDLPGGASAASALDAFVDERLDVVGLPAAPEADRETLLRRVSFDLTGLPPSVEEIDAFLADQEPGAYERVVDRLLASPHHGERMALMWLDAARYADTNGFHHDNVRTSWPYRDWVIQAFQDNMPYDDFVVQQLAGDLLEGAGDAERIASGFCRMHNINDEGGALDDEYRVEAICDRIETVATTFMGLTFTCARCHDHKYDPIEQEDYYSLYAYFNSVDERGVYANNFEQARAYPARLDYMTPEVKAELAVVVEKLAAADEDLSAAQPRIDVERLAWERAFRADRGIEWGAAELVDVASEEGQKLARLADGSVRYEGDAPYDTLTFTLNAVATDLRLVRLEALTDRSFPEGSLGLSSHGNVVINRVTATATSVRDPERSRDIEFAWAWADHEQQNGDFDIHNTLRDGRDGWALAGHQRREPRTAILVADRPFGFPGGTRVEVRVACRSQYERHIVGRSRVSLGTTTADLMPEFPIVTGDWFLAGRFHKRGLDFDTLYDTEFGPEKVETLDRDQKFGTVGWRHQPKFGDGAVHALRGEQSVFYLARTVRTPVARKVTLSLGSDDAIRVFLDRVEVHGNKAQRGAAADQDVVEVELPPGESVLVLKIVNNGGPSGFYFRMDHDSPPADHPIALVPATLRDRPATTRFANAWGAAHSPTYAALDQKVRELRDDKKALEDRAVPVLVMSELDEPQLTHVLDRGRYDMVDRSRPVSRRPPTFLGGELPDGLPVNRLGFAQWLVSDEHPLTARVHVNRLWQMLFGKGLVATSENFGHQADWPSHLELLDWLARDFIDSGWDQRALIRRIVTSATYRRSSTRPDGVDAVDPSNQWLSYFPRLRLPGEMVRDQALFVAGLLVDRIGGPSVKPYQPAGLWREVSIGGSSNTQVFERDDGAALYRRSLYTFWKRTAPNPQMTTFDAPTREFCVVRRGVTNTPLQALVLWNDVQFTEAARVFAQRVIAEVEGVDARLVRMMRACTGRRPTEEQLAVLRGVVDRFAARYAESPEDAQALIVQGQASLPESHDAVELATWMVVANTVMSLDATIVRS